jgi:predicted alpha/beta-hydrolase family hydrolase
VSTTPQLVFDGPEDAAWTVALAHGAGAGLDTPFMNAFATGLGLRGFRVVRFEFPYREESRRTGKKRPPDRESVLRATWLKVIEALGRPRLVIGGKSMGGRIASLLAGEPTVAGVVCLGYPFHPTGRPDRLRTEHLRTIATPTLIVQGTRDPFGTWDEVARYDLAPAVQVRWLEDGDHDFKPRKASGRTRGQNWEDALDAVRVFLDGL